MIYLCPFCGHSLTVALRGDGVSDCSNCKRVFNSSPFHRMMAASWVTRKCPAITLEQLIHSTKLTEAEAATVLELVQVECMCYDEVRDELKSRGISMKLMG